MDKRNFQLLMEQAWSSLSEALFVVGEFFNSAFSVALVGSAAGAIGGAIAAQKIIEKTKRRDLFLSEFRSTNAAIVVSYSICNAMLSLKKNFVRPLYQQFNEGVDAIHNFNERKELGELGQDEQFLAEVDFKLFECPSVPVETLKDLVFNRISEHGRPLAALAHLDGVLASLDKVILKRETLVEEFKKHENSFTFFYLYYGLTRPDGNTNEEYADTVEAIHEYTDDAIFFSKLICDDLVAHGNLLIAKNSKLAKKSPKVSYADFSGAEDLQLMPPKNKYEDWLGGFLKFEQD